MRNWTLVSAGIFCIAVAVGPGRPAGAQSPPAGDSAGRAGRIREAATRNLALFQQSQKRWFDVQRCDSCHHQYQPALAYQSAREHGIPFDETIARADANKAFTYADLDKAVQYSWIIEPGIDDGY